MARASGGANNMHPLSGGGGGTNGKDAESSHMLGNWDGWIE